MKEEKDILAEAGHKDGMTVPSGYFSDFAVSMAESLEKTPFETLHPQASFNTHRSFWHRVRPYVYMAAMFAGVWCMLKMFTLMSSNPNDGLQLSAGLANAMDNESFFNDYILSDVDQWDVMDQMMDEGFDLTLLDASSTEDSSSLLSEQ